MKFKKSDLISHILESREDAEEILTGFGFHCLYCPMSQMESLEEACEVHGIDANEVLKALNEEPTSKPACKKSCKTKSESKKTLSTKSNTKPETKSTKTAKSKSPKKSTRA